MQKLKGKISSPTPRAETPFCVFYFAFSIYPSFFSVSSVPPLFTTEAQRHRDDRKGKIENAKAKRQNIKPDTASRNAILRFLFCIFYLPFLLLCVFCAASFHHRGTETQRRQERQNRKCKS